MYVLSHLCLRSGCITLLLSKLALFLQDEVSIIAGSSWRSIWDRVSSIWERASLSIWAPTILDSLTINSQTHHSLLCFPSLLSTDKSSSSSTLSSTSTSTNHDVWITIVIFCCTSTITTISAINLTWARTLTKWLPLQEENQISFVKKIQKLQTRSRIAFSN